jgi:hypothetical protein
VARRLTRVALLARARTVAAMTLTITDTLGRCWTITTEATVVGFRYRIYCHRQGPDISAGALELMHPGGVAHGWTDDDHGDDRLRALLLVAFMTLKGAEVPA